MAKLTLVMIHGLVGSLDYFQPELRIVQGEVHTCDLLGYGRFRDAPSGRLTLSAQADHVARFIADLDSEPVWLLGHSMGGAVAMLLADRHPQLAAGIINVEGNFTLKDAFWSTKIITKRPEEWEDEYRAMGSDVSAWLIRCGVTPMPERVRWARDMLAWQPPATVYAMAHAIVTETKEPGYLQAVRNVVDRGRPIHLIAGERSAAAWDVPEFVRRAARSYTEPSDVGHLMMLEAPDEFCRIVDTVLASSPQVTPAD